MTKLELTVAASSLQCVRYDETTAQILGLAPISTDSSRSEQESNVLFLNCLADDDERQKFQAVVETLKRRLTIKDPPPTSNSNSTSTSSPRASPSSQIIPQSPFETVDLVFAAPQASTAALPADRTPLDGVFSSPITALHTSDHVQLCCFTHIHYDVTADVLRISALEYARSHRSNLLRQQFASWLVEDHIEKAVIATKTDGTVVFWNRFASILYQHTKEEAIGEEVLNLISSKMSIEQGQEMMEKLVLGQHVSAMYMCTRKDGSDVMVHSNTTPIVDSHGGVQLIVGVSADYSQLHNVMMRLEQLNANLEQEVVTRTEQLLARENHLRMIGAAMKESDTGVLITDQSYKIMWCNDAVSRMLGLKKDLILGMFPWELPLQTEHKLDTSNSTSSVSADGINGPHDDDAATKDSASTVTAEEKFSSLEYYFLQEKAFNEKKDHDAIKNQNNNKDDTSISNDDSAQGSSAIHPIPSSEDPSSSSSSGSTSTSRKRPPMAAICYRIDRPTQPLHVMVSVEKMPTDKPIPIPARTFSSKRRENAAAVLDLTQLEIDSYIPLVPTPNLALGQFDDTAARDNHKQKHAATKRTMRKVGDNDNTTDVAEHDHHQSPCACESCQSSKANAAPDATMQFMISLRDVTAERKAEEAQLIAERASAANEAKTQMMQMLSHELRTPLQGIMGVASTSMMDIEEIDAANTAANDETGSPADNPAISNNCTDESSGTGGVKGTMYDSLSTILASSRLLLTLINNTLDTRKINADMMQKIELSSVSMMSCIRDSFQYCGPFATINEAQLELADPAGKNIKLPQILNTSTTRKSNHFMTDALKRKYNVVGNRLRLEQVIVNLLSNGIKYTTPGTSVVASVRNSALAETLSEMKAAPSSSLKFLSEDDLKELEETCSDIRKNEVTIFSVRDHGNGIPPAEYGKVFGEFQQLDASAEKDNKYEGGGSGQSSGSGLGLNLSMKFVTLMNGHIWFKNCTDGGGGVTFSFYLKRSRSSRDSSSAAAEENDERHDRGSVLSERNRSDSFRTDDHEVQHEKMSRFRVLVIDDSMINLKVLARMMTKLKVQHCMTALSGAAALEYLEPIRNDASLVPNLILCDLQMPGMDGYELMCHLREMNICSSPVIMACSADWGSETERKCHDVGFDGLLRKPITVTYLKEFLASLKLN